MLFSRSSEYAIRACVHLARVPAGTYVMARTVAAAEQIPAHFLAKILQDLARGRVLRSNKGPSGGFALAGGRGADTISLLDVAGAIDGADGWRRCPFGIADCTSEAPCALHDSWKPVHSRIMEYMQRTTIADLAEALDRRRRDKPRKKSGR